MIRPAATASATAIRQDCAKLSLIRPCLTAAARAASRSMIAAGLISIDAVVVLVDVVDVWVTVAHGLELVMVCAWWDCFRARL